MQDRRPRPEHGARSFERYVRSLEHHVRSLEYHVRSLEHYVRSSTLKPSYWARAKRELSARDPVLGEIIGRYPRISLVRRGDPFFTLSRSVVGQQISVKAAQSVWDRLVTDVGEVLPETILAAGAARMQMCGLSSRKVEYLLELAEQFATGRIDPGRWEQIEDEAVIAELTAVRGIGRWTAEMFLIFSLLRPDVLPLGDLGLQRAVAVHYFRGRRVALSTVRRVARHWTPWRSVATWYLWRSLDPVPVEY